MFAVVGFINLVIGLVDRYPIVIAVGAAILAVSAAGGAVVLDPAPFSLVLGVVLLVAAVIARLTR